MDNNDSHFHYLRLEIMENNENNENNDNKDSIKLNNDISHTTFKAK